MSVRRVGAVAVVVLLAVAAAGSGLGLSRERQPGPATREPSIKFPAIGRAGAGMFSGEFTVAIEGAKQGKFKGEGTHEGSRDKIIGLGFEYEIKSPRDAATGTATGKRVHLPMVIMKEWGAASPQIFQAAVTNETLKSVVLEFFQSGEGARGSGASEVFYTIRLTNASIAGVKQSMQQDGRYVEEVSLVFQKIEVEHKGSKTTSSDEWGK